MGSTERGRVMLVVVDGFGWAPRSATNPLLGPHTPYLTRLIEADQPALLDASGLVVGLPAGQAGNSEVGHLTIGAGRTIPQSAQLIDRTIADGRFRQLPLLVEVFTRARDRNAAVHIVGITSSGGAHGHVDHIRAVLELAHESGFGERTYVHAITDGRDVPARSAASDLAALESVGAQMATIAGRVFGMDRVQRWDRTDRMVHAMTAPRTSLMPTWARVVETGYANGCTDQDIEPTALACGAITHGDEVIMTNFRPDGLRQLASRLADRGVSLTTMTRYDDELPAMRVFDAGSVLHMLADIVAEAGLSQVHVAEREKFGHVTYFLNGYRHGTRPGESHIVIESRTDVDTFAAAPAMSAPEITRTLLEHIANGQPKLMVANFANIDTVGHTGRYAAVRTAASVVDSCLASLTAACRDHDVTMVLTGDHGNGEQMLEADGVTPNTRHTLNPVPLWTIGRSGPLRRSGDLRDVAPTCLTLLGVSPPEVMTGRALLA